MLSIAFRELRQARHDMTFRVDELVVDLQQSEERPKKRRKGENEAGDRNETPDVTTNTSLEATVIDRQDARRRPGSEFTATRILLNTGARSDVFALP